MTVTPFTRQGSYEVDGGMLDLHYSDGQVSLATWPARSVQSIVFAPGEAEVLAQDILTDSDWLRGQREESYEDGVSIGEERGFESGAIEAESQFRQWIADLLESVGDEDNLQASVTFRSALEKRERA